MTNETNKAARKMADMIFANQKDINCVLTDAGNVKPIFMSHFNDIKTGENGLKDLICKILRNRMAEFPSGIANTRLRSIVVNASMFTSEILESVQIEFTKGSTRYPLASVATYLSHWMFKAGIVGKIKLTSEEDNTRTSPKPRCKWYLIA